jgi:hypothetical protein
VNGTKKCLLKDNSGLLMAFKRRDKSTICSEHILGPHIDCTKDEDIVSIGDELQGY